MKYLKLFEEYHQSISDFYQQHSKSYNCSLEEINKGYCDEISYNVIKDVVGENNYTSLADELYDGMVIQDIEDNTVYEIDDGVFWSDKISDYGYNGDYWIIKNLKKLGCPNFNLESLNTFMLKGHVWVYYNGKHYDAEAFNGVKNFWDLPIYQRQLKSLDII
jgi:hypothetical protein|tara:strand:- start:1759 stop:2244 length:486 start_codon:yes stop_codon:yes gene_type:complete